MSTLRISNIEAKSVPASATVDEKVKITNSSGDTLVFIDGKTSGITTVGINTTDGNIKFDANSNVVVTGIITATRFSGQITPTTLNVSGGVGIGDSIFHIGDDDTQIRFPAANTFTVETAGSERLRITSTGNLGIGTDAPAKLLHLNSSEPVIRLTDTDGPLSVDIENASGDLRLDTPSVHRDVIITSVGQANEIVRFTGDGLVGIATATPPDWCRFSIDHGQYGLTRFSNHSHLLLQNKNATTTEFWSLAPRDNGSINIVRGTSDTNGTVPITNATFSIDNLRRVGVGSDAGSCSSFFEASYTSGTVAYPFENADSSIQSYDPFPHEVTIKNNTNGAENNFCGIYFRPGAHSDGNRISAARISAIETGDYRADLTFGTRGYRNGSIGFQEVMRLDSNGNASLKTGNLSFASGSGIDFSATANSSNGSSINETLDDYEQGDIDLTLVGTSGGSANYGYRTGHYTKIGNICHVTGDIRFNGSWSGSTGSVHLNLPFTAEATGGCVGAGIVSEWNLSGSNWDNIMIKVDNNESVARFTAHSGSNNNTSNFQTNLFGNGRYLKFSFTYQTA